MNSIQTPIMKKPAVVLYTTLAIGHLAPMLEFGELVVARCPDLSVHVLLATPPANAGPGITPSIASLFSVPLITFHYLPPPPLPPDSSSSLEVVVFESLRLNNPDLRLSLESVSKTHSVVALVADFFCACAGPVIRDLGIPFYVFFPSGGGGLALFLHLSILHDSTDHQHGSEQDKSKPLNIPGLPPISLLDFPEPCRDRNDLVYQFLLESSREMSLSAGVIVNTFDALEHRAVDAIRKGECRPGEQIPTFCIGPLVSSNNEVNVVDECRTWLDRQPKGSVVFLCFGSMGVFPDQQLKEIAVGLEMSSQRFLWVVRHPAVGPGPEPDLASLLPEGFFERTEGRGKVVNTWAPQVYILRHESVGGFVTHCGWNSVLEAVCAGVPMVAWPQYAEQRLQKVQMVDEIGIALRLEEEEEGENGIVSAKEVETKVRMLMEGEEGDPVRERTTAMRDAAVAAAVTGGSSWAAFEELVKSWTCCGTR